ncbi:MAG: PA14 domain-containing protein [Chitinophagaceae bacterium]
MRTLILFLLSSCFGRSHANNYYFSSTSGNDTRSMAEAQKPTTPWKTLEKLNAVFSNLNPGDTISLKRDDVFDGTISISKSGSVNLPIVITTYGTGAKPVINGLTTLTNWASTRNGIWEANCSSNVMVNTVLVNREAKPIGRYPNSNAANKGYLVPQSYNGNDKVIDNLLLSAPDWTGGDVVIRKARWVIDRNLITQHSGNTLHYISESFNQPAAKFGSFLQNHPNALDINGEWYYKIQDKKLGIYFSSGNPSSALIQASTTNALVTLTSQNNIVFDNLGFQGANMYAFDIKYAQNIRISRCDILFSGVNAINAQNTSDLIVEYSAIDYTNNIALNLDNCSNATIRNNKIKNTGMVAGMGKGDSGSYEAILVSGNNHLIEQNEIINTGYIPVTFRGSLNIIRNNFIDNFTLVKDDGGGIYSWNNIANAPPNYGSKITGNIILNGKGAGEGTDSPEYLASNGIYMDDNTSGVEITGNTVSDCSLYGIYLHNAFDLLIENNTLFNNKSQIRMARDEFAPNSPVRNIRLLNNILFSKKSIQPVAEFQTSYNDIGDFGTFDNNAYVRPTDDNQVVNTFNWNNGNSTFKTYNLESWKTAFKKDNASKKSPFELASAESIRFEFNATASLKSFSLNETYVDVHNKSYIGNVDLRPFTSLVLLKQSAAIKVSIPPPFEGCSGTGSIVREQWNDIGGNDVQNIPLNNPPGSTDLLTRLEIAGLGNNYGARIRGYICPPATGNFIFMISGDDALELWLSTDDQPVNKRKIASLLSYTNFHEWNKFASQQSAPVNLKAGQRYYIEVLHKQGGGGDHVSVAWQLPNGVTEIPILGNRLFPYTASGVSKNDQTINFGPIPSRTLGDPPFIISATASSGLPVSFRIVSGPASLSGSTITVNGQGTVVVEASQQGDNRFNAAIPVTQSLAVAAVTTPPPSGCSTGSILREQWDNVPGNDVPNIPLNSTPSSTSQLTTLETNNIGDLYGARIRGYVCPPVTGNYIFMIAGDDAVELWLSSNDNPANKTRIASLLSWTNFREWNKHASQRSAPVSLQSGQRYYIEVLHKEGAGGDHVTVAWELPNGVQEIPIQGSRLSPYVPASSNKISSTQLKAAPPGNNPEFTITPNPFKTSASILVNPSASGDARLEVYDLHGRLVQRLFKGTLHSGVIRRFILKEEGLSDGVYIIRFLTTVGMVSRKVILAR